MGRQRDLHASHGGVHFTTLKTTQEINQFVKALPEDKKDSLFEVMQELNQAGYIRINNDGDWMDAAGEIHPHPNPYD